MSEIRHSFISVIAVIQGHHDIRRLSSWLSNLHGVLETNFSDFEFILVNNHQSVEDIDAVVQALPETLRKNIFLLNLSSAVDKNNALLAGLDRSNGDYTVIFEFDFNEKPELLVRMWEKTRENYDLVYLRAPYRKQPVLQNLLYRVFYFILKQYSDLHIDPRAHQTRIISRRALNSLLRLRENSHYLKANYALIGYNNTALDVSEPLLPDSAYHLRQQIRTGMVAVASFTSFLRNLLLWVFVGATIVALVAMFNAIKVKITSVDIFGGRHEAITGWTYLVVLMSGFFALTFLNLYVMSIYLSNIYTELKNRPPYIVESVKRY